MHNYNPVPIDTTNIELSEDIKQLTEILAKNTHDNWSLKRIKEGWSYGISRDDKKKYHPCLVEYIDLPEEEKEYDRKTAMETLKVIIAMGFKVSKA